MLFPFVPSQNISFFANDKGLEKIIAEESIENRVNIRSMKKYALNDALDSQSIIILKKFVPPDIRFAEKVKGIGFNNVLIDENNLVSKYPMVAKYDDKIYPSLACILTADYYKCPLDKISILPGKYIEFSQYDSSVFNAPLRIPIDTGGLTDLTGWFEINNSDFQNIPYNLVFSHYSIIKCKELLNNYIRNLSKEDINVVVDNIPNYLTKRLIKAGISKNNAETTSSIVFISWIMENSIENNGNNFDDFCQELGIDETDLNYKSIWDQIYFNNHVAKLLKEKKHSYLLDYKKICDELRLNYASDQIQEGWRQVNYLYNKKLLNRMRPLFFPEPSKCIVDGMVKKVSLLDLRDKFVFIGLVASGLHYRFDTPFQKRSNMFFFTQNVVNNYLGK